MSLQTFHSGMKTIRPVCRGVPSFSVISRPLPSPESCSPLLYPAWKDQVWAMPHSWAVHPRTMFPLSQGPLCCPGTVGMKEVNSCQQRMKHELNREKWEQVEMREGRVDSFPLLWEADSRARGTANLHHHLAISNILLRATKGQFSMCVRSRHWRQTVMSFHSGGFQDILSLIPTTS